MTTLAETYEAALGQLALRNPRVVVLTAENRAAIRGLPALLGDRFIDVGICEQTMVGVAAGLALRGRIPVVHGLATFLTLRAFEFIRTDVGIPGLPVKFVGGVPGLLSEANGPTHQALDDLAVMRAVPGMSIVCPVDEDELCAALPSVVADPGPVYVRHNPRRLGVMANRSLFAMGQAESIREGQDMTVLALGLLLPEVLEAVGKLEEDGLSIGVINVRSLVPLDEQRIVSAARKTGHLVTVEDHFLVGGLYQAVTEVLVRHGLGGVRVLPVGFDGRFFAPGLLADVIEHEELSGAGLAARILRFWAHRHAAESFATTVPSTIDARGTTPLSVHTATRGSSLV